MRYEIAIEAAREAVHPTPLADVLASLLQARVIDAFETGPEMLVIHADPGLECAFLVAEAGEPTRPTGSMHVLPAVAGRNRDKQMETIRARDAGRLHAETTAAYYSAAEAFVGTRAYRALPERRRAIWRLHAKGLSKYEIATELGCPSGAVARAILAIRPKAGLRRTARAIPRGRQNRSNS